MIPLPDTLYTLRMKFPTLFREYTPYIYVFRKTIPELHLYP
jgi:hypothetical protein